jgi:hypothetical protein
MAGSRVLVYYMTTGSGDMDITENEACWVTYYWIRDQF